MKHWKQREVEEPLPPHTQPKNTHGKVTCKVFRFCEPFWSRFKGAKMRGAARIFAIDMRLGQPRQACLSMIFGHFHPEKLGKISNLISIFSDGLKSLTSFSFGGVLEWEHARMVDSTRVAFFLGAEVKVMGEAPILINPRLLRRVSPSATCCLSWILSTEKKTKQGPYHLQMDLWSL